MLKLTSFALAAVMAFSSSLYFAVPDNSRIDVIACDCMECGSDIASILIYNAPADIASYSGVSWVKSGSKWYCKDNKGNYIKGVFADIGGVVYYFDANGVMKTGWQKIDGFWYYFASSGAMKTGWQKLSKKWYYFSNAGMMYTGLQYIDGSYYLFGDSGAMLTGWQQFRGSWYYLASSGAAKVSTWYKSGKVWYYFDNEGVMATGSCSIDGSYYLFNDSGKMLTGWQQYDDEWYYLTSSGAAVYGWKTIGGKQYCFDDTGMMLHDTVVDGLILDSDGHVAGAAATSPAAGTTPAIASETAPAGGTTPAAETTPAAGTTPAAETTPAAGTTPAAEIRYDPDNHGGYWIVGTNGNLSANQILGCQPSYRKITDATDFTAAAQNRLGYVCTSGYVITYSQYYQMDWSQASDPMFGGKTNTSSYCRGTYWANNSIDEDTQYVATWLYGTSGASDAFAYDNHNSGTNVVGMRVRYTNGSYTGQTWGYKAWNGNAVTGNDYSRWASAMDAYNSGSRHSSTVLAKYGITNELLGDYIMIEWCEGTLTYNLQTLPLPDYTRYTGMGSDSAHTHFTTSTSRSTSVYFPTSKTWNYSSRSANVVSTNGGTDSGSTPSATPTTSGPIVLPFVPANAFN